MTKTWALLRQDGSPLLTLICLTRYDTPHPQQGMAQPWHYVARDTAAGDAWPLIAQLNGETK